VIFKELVKLKLPTEPIIMYTKVWSVWKHF